MIDHFPVARSNTGGAGKADPQIVWNFGDDEVSVSSLDLSGDTRGTSSDGQDVILSNRRILGKAQLATELTLSVDEFDHYEIPQIPFTIAFHLKEFNVNSFNFLLLKWFISPFFY
jgi:cell cycle checkpoint control protein RAD9A